MNNVNKIGNPFFILSVLILIMNDWFFKTAFHNEITGKLSDFAGLLALPFFLSVFLYRKKKLIHVLTGILFIIWKSPLSQQIIDLANGLGLPINRTIDYTDYIALISIFVSYRLLKMKLNIKLRPIVSFLIIIVSSFGFIATTMSARENRKFVDINKEYNFSFSKRELVSRLNTVQLKEIENANKYYGQVDFDSETNVFHYNGQTDTLALLLDYNEIKDQDTIDYKTSFAEIIITGNQLSSQIKLLAVYKYVPMYKDLNYRKKAIAKFEKRIVKKIRKYR